MGAHRQGDRDSSVFDCSSALMQLSNALG